MRLSATTAFIVILSSYPALSMPLIAPSSLNSPHLAFAPIAAATLPPNVLDAIRNRLSQLQSRDVQGLMERENVASLAREIEELFARDVEDDSEAISLGKLGKIGGILLDGFNVLGDLLPGSSQPAPPSQSSVPQQRDWNELDERSFGLKIAPGILKFHTTTPTFAVPTPTSTPEVVGSLPIIERDLEERKFGLSFLHPSRPGGAIRPGVFRAPPVKSTPRPIPPKVARSMARRELQAAPPQARELVDVLARAVVDVARGLNGLD